MLAEKLGMTVSQLEAEMSVDEFIEWSLFFTIQDEEYQKPVSYTHLTLPTKA